jgi:uncharacterized protein (DUF433 family)
MTTDDASDDVSYDLLTPTESIDQYIDRRCGGYYVAGTRISLDSVVYCFNDGNAPEEIQKHFTLLDLPDIYGAIAFYLKHKEEIDEYLERGAREFGAGAIPLAEEKPELWARLERARQALALRKSER